MDQEEVKTISTHAFCTTKHCRSIFNQDGTSKHYLMKRKQMIEVPEEVLRAWVVEMQDRGYEFQEIVEITAIKKVNKE